MMCEHANCSITRLAPSARADESLAAREALGAIAGRRAGARQGSEHPFLFLPSVGAGQGKNRAETPPNSPVCLRGVCHYSHSKEKVWMGCGSALQGQIFSQLPQMGHPPSTPRTPPQPSPVGPHGLAPLWDHLITRYPPPSLQLRVEPSPWLYLSPCFVFL